MDGEALRAVMRIFPQGVVVVTAAHPQGGLRGVTVSSFMSVSLEPPLVVVCIMRKAQAHGAIETSGAFAVNILAEDQGPLSEHFAIPNLSSEEQFAKVAYQERPGRAPLLEGCLGYLDCRVVDRIEQADHTLFVGEVQAGEALKKGAARRPLIFFSRRYWGVGEEKHERD